VQISVNTVNKYIQTLEKLFLIRRLPAWSANHSKRLIKAPKLHLIDSGMACAISKLTEEHWLTHANNFGHIIESYAVQQIIAQLLWIDSSIETYHFRDQYKNEVDLVIEQGTFIWGIEMKRAKIIVPGDYKGLRILSELAGENWKGGIVFYGGDHIMKTPIKNTLAVPYGALWDGITS